MYQANDILAFDEYYQKTTSTLQNNPNITRSDMVKIFELLDKEVRNELNILVSDALYSVNMEFDASSNISKPVPDITVDQYNKIIEKSMHNALGKLNNHIRCR